jgi:hypothetical protein
MIHGRRDWNRPDAAPARFIENYRAVWLDPVNPILPHHCPILLMDKGAVTFRFPHLRKNITAPQMAVVFRERVLVRRVRDGETLILEGSGHGLERGRPARFVDFFAG